MKIASDRSRSQIRAYRNGRILTSIGGSATEVLGPLIVVTTLNGQPGDVAVLLVVTLGVSLILRLPLSVWADRQVAQTRWMILFAVLSGLWTLVIPVIWLEGVLSLPLLFAWTTINVALLTLLSVLGHGVLNQISEPDQRIKEIGLLSSATSTGDIVGQSAAPALLAVIAAPLAMLIDTVTSIAAAAWWFRLAKVDAHASDDRNDPTSSATFWLIARRLFARPNVWIAALAAVISSVTAPLSVYYFVRTIGIDPAWIGLLLAAGAVGAIASGAVLGTVHARVNSHVLVIAGLLCMSLPTALVAVLPAHSGIAYVGIALIELVTAAGGTFVMATVFGTIQAETLGSDISRTMSLASFLIEGLGIAGLGLGAALAASLPVPVIYVWAGVAFLLLAGTSVPFAVNRHREQGAASQSSKAGFV